MQSWVLVVLRFFLIQDLRYLIECVYQAWHLWANVVHNRKSVLREIYFYSFATNECVVMINLIWIWSLGHLLLIAHSSWKKQDWIAFCNWPNPKFSPSIIYIIYVIITAHYVPIKMTPQPASVSSGSQAPVSSVFLLSWKITNKCKWHLQLLIGVN